MFIENTNLLSFLRLTSYLQWLNNNNNARFVFMFLIKASTSRVYLKLILRSLFMFNDIFSSFLENPSAEFLFSHDEQSSKLFDLIWFVLYGKRKLSTAESSDFFCCSSERWKNSDYVRSLKTDSREISRGMNEH